MAAFTKQREAQREGGIENGEAQGFAFAVADGGAEGARLHDAGMQVEIVRHHRGAQNADGDIQHFAVAKNFAGAG